MSRTKLLWMLYEQCLPDIYHHHIPVLNCERSFELQLYRTYEHQLELRNDLAIRTNNKTTKRFLRLELSKELSKNFSNGTHLPYKNVLINGK